MRSAFGNPSGVNRVDVVQTRNAHQKLMSQIMQQMILSLRTTSVHLRTCSAAQKCDKEYHICTVTL